MGGNQSMRDAATALPLLQQLNEERLSGHVVKTDDISRACKMLEDEMIPRAFSWVRKSGGFNITVRRRTSVQRLETNQAFSHWIPVLSRVKRSSS
jgi:hypothetical protein